ncbi:putative bolA-like protein C8C9.11 [Drechslerella stenobrocha 248]|uniref:Putative bolA-like protein C8C9.11 n=1 Tax=Drechslerella stenobrocha 248 TaxID=1043628 RepID=W7I6W4_9PEZI|nr:putative bolA-like protein C8C9.11 [Drechslerella stenobrocha 248]
MAEGSGVTAESLEQTIREKLDATHVTVVDNSGGCGQIFEAVIVSAQFEGKTSLAKSRLVNTALKEEIAKVHAWSNKTYTPAQWEKVKGAEAAGGV